MRTLYARLFRWQTGLAVALILAGLCCTDRLGLVQLACAYSDEDDDPAEPGLLVLTEDRVVSGRIIRNGQNYLVKLPNGQMFVPASAVLLRCRNLQDAYRQLRLGFPENHGAESHMRLARWCVTQRMLSEARQELKDALRMEPDRAEANDMLQRIEAMLDSANLRRPQEEKNIPAIVEAARQGIRPDEIESLGGLPKDAATQFVRRIQPLMMSHCALSGCHGPQEEQKFRLQRTILGNHSNRHAVERNLANVLKFIDIESPKQSPLLVKSKGAHGKRGRSIFVGQRGAEQYRELRDWVLTVATSRDEPATVASRKPAGRRSGSKVQQASHRGDASADSSVEPAIASAPSNPFPDALPRKKGKSTSGERSRPSRGTSDEDSSPAISDPFDPDEFNRQGRK